MPKVKVKSRSSNIVAYMSSNGDEVDLDGFLTRNLAAGARLAAQNEVEVHDPKTARTYELRLIALEKFARQEGDNAVLFGENKRPFMAATIKTSMQYLGEPRKNKIGSLQCKGLNPPSIKGHEAAFRFWFTKFGHVGPYKETVVRSPTGEIIDLIPSGNTMDAPGVKQTIKQLLKRARRPRPKDVRRGMTPYEPKAAPPFKLQDLLRIQDYCLKTIEGLRGLWMATISLFSFALFLRGEEPLRLKMKHITFPSNFDVNSGNIPQRLEVKIPWSKADKHAKGVTLSLWANPGNPLLCPVTALFIWLLSTGIRSGYVFPRVAKDNRKCLHTIRGVSSYRKTFSEMCKALFEKPYSTHSIRRSAARWAARCGADDSTIRRAGRWKSNSFELYTQDARAEMIKEHHDGSPVQDHLMWMFKPLR